VVGLKEWTKPIRWRVYRVRRDRGRRRTVREHLDLPRLDRCSGAWAVSIVRDEADTIGHVIGHLLAEGISRVVVADHLSRDATPSILRSLGEDRRVIATTYSHPGYFQDEVMTALARLAARSGAEWVIPFDGDEMWWAPGMTLAEYLRDTDAAVVRAESWEYVPSPADDLAVTDPLTRIGHRRRDPSLGESKVAFRASRRARVRMGNHDVRRRGSRTQGLVIAHYRYRSLEHLVSKIRAGIAALDAANYSEDTGWHWRQLADMSTDELAERWQEIMAAGVVLDPDAQQLRRHAAVTHD
jgi:hypothetical protein